MSTFASFPELKLVSRCVRVNLTALFCFRLVRYAYLLEACIQEFKSLVDEILLLSMYRAATARPYGFLYINLLAQDIDHMFYSSFLSRFTPSVNGTD